jgi:release factor glutamine methyltransferase
MEEYPPVHRFFFRSNKRRTYGSAVTVLEGIQKSAGFLEKKGIESPRLQAELLLAHVLKLPRMQLYLKFERLLADAEVDQLRELVRRRGAREPLQHIVGSTSFCGLEISVNRHVLVPRPEAELLAEAGWRFLNSLGREASGMDFGTGSGCLAVALAVKCPVVRILATDISAEALDTARQNAARHAVQDRVAFLQSDAFTNVPATSKFDLIASNPPYVSSAEIELLEPEVRDYDPRGALDGGADGLDAYRRIASDARRFLEPGGRLMLEIGDEQAPNVRALLEAQKWIVDEIRRDYTQRERIVIARLD